MDQHLLKLYQLGSTYPSGFVKFNYPSTLTCRRGVEEKRYRDSKGNRIRRGYDAAFKGNTLKSKSHECQWHETKPQGDLRSKPLRG